MVHHPRQCILRGALRVRLSMPGTVGRWPSSPFGLLGMANTSRFHGPLCTGQRSWRLFLEYVLLIASKQALSYHDAGIPIGITSHLALWAIHERGSYRIAFGWLSCVVTSNQRPTTSACSASIAGRNTTGYDALIPGFVFGIAEDFPP